MASKRNNVGLIMGRSRRQLDIIKPNLIQEVVTRDHCYMHVYDIFLVLLHIICPLELFFFIFKHQLYTGNIRREK